MTKNKRPMGLANRRRPKRQRTPTTLYSDDNPSTFTIKKTKHERLMEELSQRQQEQNEEIDPPSPTKQQPPRQKRKYTKRKHKHHSDDDTTASPVASPTTTRTVASDAGRRGNNARSSVPMSNALTTSDTPPVKRKRGRPPKNRKPESAPVITASTTTVKKMTVAVATREKPPPPPPRRVPTSKPARTPPPPPPQPKVAAPIQAPSPPRVAPPVVNDEEGTLMPHSVTVTPILPPMKEYDLPATTSSGDTKKSLTGQYRAIFGKGLGVSKPLKPAGWTSLYTPEVYFDRDYTYDNANDDDGTGNDMDSDSQSFRRLDPDLMPVTRSVTCVATRRPDHQFMAVGDTAGFCIIYSLGPHIRPVARLESQACQQRAYDQQQSVRAQRKKIISKRLRSLTVDTSKTTILALGFVASRIVLATACELECMDIPSQTSLWVCPLSATDRMVTSLDMHIATYDVLVSCKLLKFSVPATDHQTDSAKPVLPSAPPTRMASSPSSPLMLLKHSQNNVEICDANSPILVKSPCCTAIWDTSPSKEDRLLFVAPDQEDQELELVLVQGGSMKVACKTRIPVKSSMFETKLSQSPRGVFTMVASSRGIRLYQTETLQLLHVYGDQLALHGKSIVWQDCVLLCHHRHRNYYRASCADGGVEDDDEDGNNTNSASHERKHSRIEPPPPPPCGPGLVEYEDALMTVPRHTAGRARLGDVGTNKSLSNHDDFADLGQYIIGVPHPTKGPKELCESLHVWKVAQATAVPAMAIPLPPKSDGVQSLVVASQTSSLSRDAGTSNALCSHDRLVLATRAGTCHELLPKIESNFAGIMYPAGYHVLNDNLDYIEDEDELDIVIPGEEDDEEELKHLAPVIGKRKRKPKRRSLSLSDSDEEVIPEVDEDGSDEDLKEAMRRSMLELRSVPGTPAIEDDDVSVVVDVVGCDGVDDQRPVSVRPPVNLPCRPEPYLRQYVVEDADDEETDGLMIQSSSKRHQDVDGVDSFLHDILGAMPHVSLVEKSRIELVKRQEKNGTMMPSLKQQLTHLPAQEFESASSSGDKKQDATRGRGKRSRAATLEAMLKASIDPKLQQLMVARQHIWADGAGSFLLEPEKDDTYMDGQKGKSDAAAEGNAASEPTDDIMDVDHTTGTPEVSTNINSVAPGDGEDDRKVPAKTTSNTKASGVPPTNGAKNNSSAKETEKLNGHIGQDATTSNGAATAKDAAPAAEETTIQQVSPESKQAISLFASSISSSFRPEETAVALGLLGLGPCVVASNKGSEDAYSSYSADMKPHESSSECASESGRSDAKDQEDQDSPSKTKPIVPLDPNVKCNACRGRMVIHSCGKRALPIDFEEVVRAERDRKEKEEVEKRKARAEKRRLADAKRREARKQKQRELVDHRRREEDEEMRQRGETGGVATHSFEHDRDSCRRHLSPSIEEQTYGLARQAYNDQDVTLDPATQATYPQSDPQPALAKPPELASSSAWNATSDRIDTYDYGSRDYRQETHDAPRTSYVYGAETQDDTGPRASYEASGASEGYAREKSSKSRISREDSVTTLSSAEALAALASFAGSRAAPMFVPPEDSTPAYSNVAAAAPGPSTTSHSSASHGFSKGDPWSAENTASSIRRLIPSYAAIRAQENGDHGFGGYKPMSNSSLGNVMTSNGTSGRSEERWSASNGSVAGVEAPIAPNGEYLTTAVETSASTTDPQRSDERSHWR